MLLTIHNLPLHTEYSDVKELIISKCGLRDCIVDNFVQEGGGIRVTVGVMEEEDAAILVRKINGLYYRGQQLYVQDKRQKKESEQPYRTKMPPGQQPQQQQQQHQTQQHYDLAQQAQQYAQMAMNNVAMYPGQEMVSWYAAGNAAMGQQNAYMAYGMQQQQFMPYPGMEHGQLPYYGMPQGTDTSQAPMEEDRRGVQEQGTGWGSDAGSIGHRRPALSPPPKWPYWSGQEPKRSKWDQGPEHPDQTGRDGRGNRRSRSLERRELGREASGRSVHSSDRRDDRKRRWDESDCDPDHNSPSSIARKRAIEAAHQAMPRILQEVGQNLHIKHFNLPSPLRATLQEVILLRLTDFIGDTYMHGSKIYNTYKQIYPPKTDSILYQGVKRLVAERNGPVEEKDLKQFVKGSDRSNSCGRDRFDDQDSRGDNQNSHYSVNRGSRFDDNRPSRFDDNRPSRFDDNRPSRFDDNRPSRFGDNRPSRFDDNRPSRFDDNRPSRFDDNRRSRSNDNQYTRHDDHQAKKSRIEDVSVENTKAVVEQPRGVLNTVPEIRATCTNAMMFIYTDTLKYMNVQLDVRYMSRHSPLKSVMRKLINLRVSELVGNERLERDEINQRYRELYPRVSDFNMYTALKQMTEERNLEGEQLENYLCTFVKPINRERSSGGAHAPSNVPNRERSSGGAHAPSNVPNRERSSGGAHAPSNVPNRERSSGGAHAPSNVPNRERSSGGAHAPSNVPNLQHNVPRPPFNAPNTQTTRSPFNPPRQSFNAPNSAQKAPRQSFNAPNSAQNNSRPPFNPRAPFNNQNPPRQLFNAPRPSFNAPNSAQSSRPRFNPGFKSNPTNTHRPPFPPQKLPSSLYPETPQKSGPLNNSGHPNKSGPPNSSGTPNNSAPPNNSGLPNEVGLTLTRVQSLKKKLRSNSMVTTKLIIEDMGEQLGIQPLVQIPTHSNLLFNALRAAILLRVSNLAGDPETDLYEAYYEKYPRSEMAEFYKKIKHKVDTTGKFNQVRVDPYMKEWMRTLVKDPKPVPEPAPNAGKKNKLPQVMPVAPPPRPSTGLIPNYPQGNKKIAIELKRQDKLVQKSLPVYAISPALDKALIDEIEKIGAIIKTEFRKPLNERDRAAFAVVKQKPCVKYCQRFLGHAVSKRVTGQGVKMCRIYGHPSPPKRRDLTELLSRYNCLSLKKSVKSPFLTALFNNYEIIDELCAMAPINIGGKMVSFKPMNLTTPKTKYSSIQAQRKKYIKCLVENSQVNLLDKDWPIKEEEEKRAKEAKKIKYESDDVIIVENDNENTIDLSQDDEPDIVEVEENENDSKMKQRNVDVGQANKPDGPQKAADVPEAKSDLKSNDDPNDSRSNDPKATGSESKTNEQDQGFLHEDFQVIDEVRESDNDENDTSKLNDKESQQNQDETQQNDENEIGDDWDQNGEDWGDLENYEDIAIIIDDIGDIVDDENENRASGNAEIINIADVSCDEDDLEDY